MRQETYERQLSLLGPENSEQRLSLLSHQASEQPRPSLLPTVIESPGLLRQENSEQQLASSLMQESSVVSLRPSFVRNPSLLTAADRPSAFTAGLKPSYATQEAWREGNPNPNPFDRTSTQDYINRTSRTSRKSPGYALTACDCVWLAFNLVWLLVSVVSL